MSQSVDTKIVELRFDNNNFEDKVDSTLTKLQNLNKTIDEKGLSKSLLNLGKNAKSVDMSGITNGVEEATKGFSKLQVVGITALANITNSAVNLGKKLISNLISPITKGGLTRAMNIEQASFQFEGMNIGKSEGHESLGYYHEVMEAVLGTAYSYDVAAKAASQLAASNVGVIDKTKKLADGTTITAKVMDENMTHALLGIAGVASMTGSDFDSIAQIFTRVAGQGRVMANDLNSIASRGLNAAAVLAGALNKTEAEVRDMVSKGEIDFKTFSDAMYNAYGAHAKDSTLMFTGALEDVKAALARIGADFYGPALNAARDVLNSITPLVDVLHDKIQNALNSTGNLLDKTSKKVSQYFDLISAALKWMEIDKEGMHSSYFGWVDDNINSYSNLMDLFVKPAEVREAIDNLSVLGLRVGDVTKKIDGWQLLCDYLALSLTDVNEGVDNGVIGLNTLYKALRDISGRSEDLIAANAAGEVTQAIEDYISTFAEAGANSEEYASTLETLTSIFTGFASVVDASKTIFKGFASILVSLLTHLRPLGTLFVNATVAFSEFITLMANKLKTSESFTSILDSMVNLISKLFTIINLNKVATTILDGLTKAFDFLANAIERVHNGLAKIVGAVNTVAGKIVDKIREILSNTELLRELFESLKTAGIAVFVLGLVDALAQPAKILQTISKSLTDLKGSVGGLFDKIGEVFKSIAGLAGKIGAAIDEVTQTLKKMQELIIATAILEIALAVAALAGALYFLSKVNMKSANSSLIALVEILAILVGLLGAAKFLDQFKTKSFKWQQVSDSVKDIAKAFVLMAISLAIIAGAISILAKLDTNDMVVAFAVIEVIMWSLAGIAKMLTTTMTRDTGIKWLIGGKKQTQMLTKGLYQLIFLAEAIKIVSKSIVEIAGVTNKEALWNSVAIVELIMWSMAAIVKWLSGDSASKMVKGSMTLLAMALSMKMLVKPITELATLAATNNDAMWSAVGAISVLMAVMSLLTKMLSGTKGAIKNGIGLVLMAAAIKILEDVVISFSSLNAEAMWQSIIGIAAMLGAITLSLALIDTDGLLAKALAFVAVAIALGQLSDVVLKYGADSEATWAGIGALAVSLLLLAGACALFDKVPIGGILKLFLTLALGVVIVAGFGAAIGVFGIGMSIFAAGLTAMADAVKAISEIGGEFIIFMAALVVGIGMLTSVGLPAIAVILALSLAFLMLGGGFALMGSGLSNIAAAVKVITEFDDKLGAAAKNLVKFVKELTKMDEDAEKVKASTSTMADSISNLGRAAKGAARNIDTVENAGKKIAESFGKGITANTASAEKAATNMVNKAVAKIRNNYNQWYSVGSYLVNGLINGLNSRKSAVESKAKELANAAEKALREAAKVQSPSKVWMEIGDYMGEGLAVGITKSSNMVVSATEGLASASEMALTSAIASISDAISNDVNTNPVITPVVDLSEVRSGASFINSAFGSLSGIRGNGLAASITHTIQNGGKSDMERSIDDLTDQIGTMTDTMNSRSLNNYITVDGATDPEAFADGLIRSFRLNARTV